jgi:hypothetical protein
MKFYFKNSCTYPAGVFYAATCSSSKLAGQFAKLSALKKRFAIVCNKAKL